MYVHTLGRINLEPLQATASKQHWSLRSVRVKIRVRVRVGWYLLTYVDPTNWVYALGTPIWANGIAPSRLSDMWVTPPLYPIQLTKLPCPAGRESQLIYYCFLEPQSRFGDKLLGIREDLPPKRKCGSTRVNSRSVSSS